MRKSFADLVLALALIILIPAFILFAGLYYLANVNVVWAIVYIVVTVWVIMKISRKLKIRLDKNHTKEYNGRNHSQL